MKIILFNNFKSLLVAEQINAKVQHSVALFKLMPLIRCYMFKNQIKYTIGSLIIHSNKKIQGKKKKENQLESRFIFKNVIKKFQLGLKIKAVIKWIQISGSLLLNSAIKGFNTLFFH